MQRVGTMQRVGAMQVVGTMQIVNTIKVRPMKAVVIIQVIIMKCAFGMPGKSKNLRNGRKNQMAATIRDLLMITRIG